MVGPKSNIEEAQDALKAEQGVLTGKSDEPEAKEPEPPKPVKKPAWLEELGFCRVGIHLGDMDGDPPIVVVDPGYKFIQYLEGLQDENPESLGKAYGTMAKAVKRFDFIALSDCPELELSEGSALPLPSTLLRNHRAEWDAWRKERHAVEKKNFKARKEDPEGFLPDLVPDPPETKLGILLSEALPSRVFLRILSAIQWAVRPGGDDDYEGN